MKDNICTIFCHILFAFSETCNFFFFFFFFFLIFQNQSAAGDVIQQIKKKSLSMNVHFIVPWNYNESTVISTVLHVLISLPLLYVYWLTYT